MGIVSIDKSLGNLKSQLYGQLKRAILTRRLEQGEQLLPSRVLAEETGVSRNTVLRAYDQLVAEGYVESRQGSGLYVSRIEKSAQPRVSRSRNQRIKRSKLAERVGSLSSSVLHRNNRKGCRYEFLYGEPSYENFPHEAWARMLGKVARDVTQSQLSYTPFQGIPALREQVAGYLKRARGINCTPEDIVIVHGTQDAIDLTVRMLIDEGDTVILEHPFYRGFFKAARGAGAHIQFVDVDEQGLDSTRFDESAKLAFVTPSHQFPTGSVMSINRRLELLNWASAQNAIVFEDDYDGEFRYNGAPVDSLKSLDEAGVVIYVGTTSKTFFPSLRLGWMVVPGHLRDDICNLRSIADTTLPTMEQLALARFIQAGHFERHIFRTRKRYAEKRKVLLGTLTEELGDNIVIRGSDAGIHILVQVPGLPSGQSENLLQRCLARDVSVHLSSAYYNDAPGCVELVMGYNAMPIGDVEVGARIVAQEIGRLLATFPPR